MADLRRLLVLSACVLGLGGLPAMGGMAIAQSSALSAEQSGELARAALLILESVDLTERGQFEEAIAIAEDAFVIKGNILGMEHPDVVRAFNLADIYYAQGSYESAVVLYDRVRRCCTNIRKDGLMLQ